MIQSKEIEVIMSKKGLHPKMSVLTLECSNGDKYQILWTGKEEVVKLHADPFNHPAWTGETKLDISTGRAAAFLEKFGG